MKKYQKKKKSLGCDALSSPTQALEKLRKEKLRRHTDELRAVCLRKIRKFCGPPLEVPIATYLPGAVAIVEAELKALNWNVTRQSGLEGQNPIIILAMRAPGE